MGLLLLLFFVFGFYLFKTYLDLVFAVFSFFGLIELLESTSLTLAKFEKFSTIVSSIWFFFFFFGSILFPRSLTPSDSNIRAFVNLPQFWKSFIFSPKLFPLGCLYCSVDLSSSSQALFLCYPHSPIQFVQ